MTTATVNSNPPHVDAKEAIRELVVSNGGRLSKKQKLDCGLTIEATSIADDGCHSLYVLDGETKILHCGVIVTNDDDCERFTKSVCEASEKADRNEVDTTLFAFRVAHEFKSQKPDIEALLANCGLEMPWTSDQLNEADVSVNYLVNDVLAERQPCVIAGAYKTLKTSTAVELAISLASGREFFGRFAVPNQKRCLVFTAESGKSAIQETARRIAAEKGVELSTLEIAWGWWVPKAATESHLKLLRALIEHLRSEVVIVDPLYLSLSGEIQSNLSLAGEQIDSLMRVCVDVGTTPICLDHVKRSSNNAMTYQPLELGDVTGAGKAEFFRQWILIGRREKFDPETMIHRLWLTIGGNDGHAGQYAIDIDESRDDAGNRTWSVELMNASEAIDDAQERRSKQKKQQTEAKLERDAQSMRDAFIGVGQVGLTKSAARDRAGINGTRAEAAIGLLLRRNVLEACRVTNGGGTFDGYRINPNYRSEGSDRSVGQ